MRLTLQTRSASWSRTVTLRSTAQCRARWTRTSPACERTESRARSAWKTSLWWTKQLFSPQGAVPAAPLFLSQVGPSEKSGRELEDHAHVKGTTSGGGAVKIAGRVEGQPVVGSEAVRTTEEVDDLFVPATARQSQLEHRAAIAGKTATR